MPDRKQAGSLFYIAFRSVARYSKVSHMDEALSKLLRTEYRYVRFSVMERIAGTRFKSSQGRLAAGRDQACATNDHCIATYGHGNNQDSNQKQGEITLASKSPPQT